MIWIGGVHRPGRSKLERIEALHPKRDCQEIARLTYRYELPYDHRRATEVALLRTFAIPSISAILAQSGEFERRTQKRFDDTDILLTNLVEKGYDHPDGKLVIRKMNRMHRRFAIDNDQYRYVMSTFVVEPLRWNRRFGYRPMSHNETVGLFWFWTEVGRRMAIQELFDSVDAMIDWYDGYEHEHMVYAESNRRVADPVIESFLKRVPRPLRAAATALLLAPLDDRLLRAIGREPPSDRLRQQVQRGLRARGRLAAAMPTREPGLYSDVPRPTYPSGFSLRDVGADGPIDDDSVKYPG